MPSLDPLLPHLYGGYTANWSSERWRILRELAEGRNPGGQAETGVTAALCATGGPVGHKLAGIFLGISGQPANPNAEMIDPSEYAVRQDRRLHYPDAGVRDSATNRPLLLVECKRDAHINGYPGYCLCDPDVYSNQVICYPHGCWTSPGTLDRTGFLWVHPRDTRPWRDGINERQLGKPNWIEYLGSDQAIQHVIETQGTAIKQWRTATWEDIVARIHSLREPAAEVIATIINTWLAR
jgi:hypothetical protein